MKLSRPLTWTAFALAAAPFLMASNCASMHEGEQVEEYAADYCDELLPQAEEQMAQSYEEEGGDTDRVAASVTGPFGETVEMEIEVESSSDFDSSEPEEKTIQTGLSDLVLNCGASPHDDRTCAVQVFLDGELIGRGNFQTTGQLPMRCLPAGQRELQILSLDGHKEVHREVITIESDREYMAQVSDDLHTGRDGYFEIYAESDLTHGFSMPVKDDRQGDSVQMHIEHEHYEAEHHDAPTHQPAPRQDPGSGAQQDAAAAGAQPMSTFDFEDLVNRVDDATFDSDKRDLVEDAMAHNYFTADQAATLVDRIDSMHDQQDLAIKFYPLVVDPGQFHVVIDAVDSSIGRDNVRDELGL